MCGCVLVLDLGCCTLGLLGSGLVCDLLFVVVRRRFSGLDLCCEFCVLYLGFLVVGVCLVIRLVWFWRICYFPGFWLFGFVALFYLWWLAVSGLGVWVARVLWLLC